MNHSTSIVSLSHVAYYIHIWTVSLYEW